MEQALLSEKARACGAPRGPEASHSRAGLSVERTEDPGVGSLEAAGPCKDCQLRRSLMWT